MRKITAMAQPFPYSIFEPPITFHTTLFVPQEVNDAATKLEAVRDNVEAKALLKEMLVLTNHELCESVAYPDGDEEKVHRANDVSAFMILQENVRKNTEICETTKRDISAIRESISDLRQAEDALKSQHLRLLEHCRIEEERGGVTGFQDVHEHLVATSKETSSMNELLSRTLEDMSEMSHNITTTIDRKKHELERKMRQIKEERKHVQEIRERHESEKAKYDGAVERLMADINGLKSECSRLQKDWMEKERLLYTKNGIATSNLTTLPELGNTAKERRDHGINQSAEFANLKKLLELLYPCQ